MPAVSEKQRRFMGAELARKRAGEKTRTGMNETQLREFAAGSGDRSSRRSSRSKRSGKSRTFGFGK